MMHWEGQCQIQYRLRGVVREWGIGCHADVDTEASMRAHLAHYYPQAEFLGCCITRVHDGAIVLDTRANKVLDRQGAR